MNAQQQLVELLSVIARGDAILGQSLRGRNATNRKCGEFIRDHGPALVELIEAARRSLPHLPVDETCCGFPVGGYMDNNYCEPPSCCGNPVYPRQELKSVLDKLTEPK